MKDNQLQVILSEQNVAKENAKALLEAFGAPFEEAGVILSSYETIVVTDESQKDLMAEAKQKRLTLKKIRTTVENKRKELKEDSLRTGKAIDSVAKFVKDAIVPAENYLELQEKFAEMQEAKRVAARREERLQKMQPYTDNPFIYDFFQMSEDDFNELLATLKLQHEMKLAEEKRTEEERLAKEKAEAEEKERIRAENAKLKEEAEKREAELEKERKAAEEREAKLQAERESEQRAAQKKLDEEREKREAIEAEQRAEREKLEAERKQQEEQQRQALLAPDKEKLLALAVKIEQTELPALASKDAQAVLNQVEELLGKVSTYIRGNVKGL